LGEEAEEEFSKKRWLLRDEFLLVGWTVLGKESC
jgi:hypothetical protein